MIQSKEKPCKGTGKAKGYGCGKLTLHRIYGLGKMCCYSDWLLNSEAGQLKLQKATLKATKPRRDLQKAIEEDNKFNKLETLKTSVKNACHKYIKARDKYKPCISCNTSWNADFQAGHYYKAETYSTIKFNELNIHGQCRKCNLRKDGNFTEYKFNLPNRIGQEAFEEIEYLASIDKMQNFKWERAKLTEIRTYYNQKIKQLKP